MKKWKLLEEDIPMTYHEQQAFVKGANAMLEWMDTSMAGAGAGAGRSYDIKTYKIRSFMKLINKENNYIYKFI